MTRPPVVVGLGEVLWDVYPDAAHFGGAPANVAMHAASLGAEAWMASAVGTDARGDEALAVLRGAGVHVETVGRDSIHATGDVLVTLDADGKASYEIAADRAWDHLAWTPALAALAARTDAVCFGSLGQRSAAARETIRRFVAATPPAALRVFDVNLRQRFYDAEVLVASLRLATAVKLNDEELPIVAELCGVTGADDRAVLQALCDAFDLSLAALTCGPRGSLLVADGTAASGAAPPIVPVDTVGAGDSFTATLIVGRLAGLPLAEINRRANAVAAYVCQQRGATPALPAEFRVGA